MTQTDTGGWEILEQEVIDLLEKGQRGTLSPRWKEVMTKNGPRRLGPYLELVFTVHRGSRATRYQACFYIGKSGSERAKAKLEHARDVMRMVLKETG
jgi:hypothetical protein